MHSEKACLTHRASSSGATPAAPSSEILTFDPEAGCPGDSRQISNVLDGPASICHHRLFNFQDIVLCAAGGRPTGVGQVSDGNKALKAARDYAKDVQKPFPALDDQVLLEEKNWPRGCYVFEGNTTTPTIVFMPLFNRNNCKDADEWASRMDEFKTVQWNYSHNKTQDLLDTAQGNIHNCKDVLVEEINKAVQRRREKISANHQ